jgi:hypothetical protein
MLQHVIFRYVVFPTCDVSCHLVCIVEAIAQGAPRAQDAVSRVKSVQTGDSKLQQTEHASCLNKYNLRPPDGRGFQRAKPKQGREKHRSAVSSLGESARG